MQGGRRPLRGGPVFGRASRMTSQTRNASHRASQSRGVQIVWGLDFAFAERVCEADCLPQRFPALWRIPYVQED